MQIPIQRWQGLDADTRHRLLSRSQQDIDALAEQVRSIVSEVRSRGDAALREFTARFDGVRLEGPLVVQSEEYEAAAASLSRPVREALDFSIENVRRAHEHQQRPPATTMETRPGVRVGERVIPLDSVGLYVPRGRGSFPSMLYMLAVPAAIAGVEQISVVTPPAKDGTVDAACLYAARRCGVTTVYRVGGAQAIAAFAYGTESISPVVKIVGPGSAYVAAAKRCVRDVVDVGLPAGPSESLVVADGSADGFTVARDLLIEAEHGADSQAILVTTEERLAEEVAELLPELIAATPEPRRGFLREVFGGYGGVIIASDLNEAADIVNTFAPEHLQLRLSDSEKFIPRIRNAGEILLGAWTPFSLANYAAGANAVLPTGGGARVFSGVSVDDFLKRVSVVEVTPPAFEEISGHVATLADYEGFHWHAQALRDRQTRTDSDSRLDGA